MANRSLQGQLHRHHQSEWIGRVFFRSLPSNDGENSASDLALFLGHPPSG